MTQVKMKKLAAGAAAATLVSAGLVALTAQPASAAAVYNFTHGTNSVVVGMYTYAGWKCDGHMDLVYRGQEAEMDVRSVKVPAGDSLWYGKYYRVGNKKTTTHCQSLWNFPTSYTTKNFWMKKGN